MLNLCLREAFSIPSPHVPDPLLAKYGCVYVSVTFQLIHNNLCIPSHS